MSARPPIAEIPEDQKLTIVDLDVISAADRCGSLEELSYAMRLSLDEVRIAIDRALVVLPHYRQILRTNGDAGGAADQAARELAIDSLSQTMAGLSRLRETVTRRAA